MVESQDAQFIRSCVRWHLLQVERLIAYRTVPHGLAGILHRLRRKSYVRMAGEGSLEWLRTQFPEFMRLTESEMLAKVNEWVGMR